ncbi:MAG: DUF4231 domain-containing protein [Gammaproteobacteria bacterium]
MENTKNDNSNHCPTYEEPRSYGSMSPEEYIAIRLNPIREWYDKKARRFKKLFLWMRTVTVLGGAIVPVLINIQIDKIEIITTLLSVLVVVFISLESVFHFREQWKNYRTTDQLLSREYFSYATADGAYRDLDEHEAFLNFVDRVENAIASESATTLSVMTTLTTQKVESAASKK